MSDDYQRNIIPVNEKKDGMWLKRPAYGGDIEIDEKMLTSEGIKKLRLKSLFMMLLPYMNGEKEADAVSTKLLEALERLEEKLEGKEKLEQEKNIEPEPEPKELTRRIFSGVTSDDE